MRGGIYVRVSTDDQRDNGYSIDSQLRMIKEYCEKNDYDIVDVYNDAGHSGKDLMRPEMQRLLKDIKSKKIDKLVAIKVDRLTRNNYDVSTANGEMILGMNLVFGQRERKEIGARTKHAMVVKEIFELCKQGNSTRGIATIMKDNNAYLKQVKWKADRVYKILTNFLVKNKHSNYGEYIHLFSGLVKCPICGEIMSSSESFKYPNGKQKVYYHLRCKNQNCNGFGLHYNTEKIEAKLKQVLEELTIFMLSMDNVIQKKEIIYYQI